MGNKNKFNEYEIIGNVVYIFLKDRNKNIICKTTIDLEDLEYIENLGLSFHASWSCDMNSYYARATQYISPTKSNTIYLHKLITKDQENITDHKDGNTLNNQKSNLSIVTPEINSKNRRKCNSNNIVGYRNVSYFEGKYLVQLSIDGKNTLLGRFSDPEEANEFAISMRKKYYFEE